MVFVYLKKQSLFHIVLNMYKVIQYKKREVFLLLAFALFFITLHYTLHYRTTLPYFAVLDIT